MQDDDEKEINICLSLHDTLFFFEILKNPPVFNEKFVNALKDYQEKKK